MRPFAPHGNLVLSALLLTATCSSATGQVVAFPGAEGAGKFAVGGRNSGNVYVVTNLNDSGTGSLRYGVDTAPASGRTIVFGVSGAINLVNDLVIDSPYITIAGQSAPEGGITLARRTVRVNNTHNVILQHLRIRPGDYYTGGPSGPPTGYEPDGLWVSGSNNVIVDHISASWTTDEVLSVTHGSTNVTVQWSMITEALNDSNHSSGTHGFGSIIHGGETTLHHNLYANNRSRNPATGNWDKSTPITPAHLDIVNNVISNPGDRYSYSGGDDQYEVNWVGNYGIEGPDTTREGELFHPDNVNTLVYYAGNYYDSQEDGILDLLPASSRTLTGASTALSSPVATTHPPTLYDAPTAYAQVLSYAGASAHRDPIDKRVIDDVVNQSGSIIDSQADVGGWYNPESVSQQLDPDGLPDWWKTANGFDPNDNSIGVRFASDGYTYLEKYLHELNDAFLPPDATQQLTVTTAYGAGADGQVTEVFGGASGSGAGGELSTRWVAGERDEMILLRFDLSGVKPGSIAGASLELTAFRDLPSDTVRVYGLKHDLSNQEWDEGAVSVAAAPGVAFDGNSNTRDLLQDDLLLLGEFTGQGVQEGETLSFTNPDLSVFLNLLAYRDANSSIVTLLLQRQDNSAVESGYASKESTSLESGTTGPAGSFAPRLVLEAVASAAAPLAGDYNDDGVVDAIDYAVWREAIASGGTLQNETESIDTVDQADFQAWLTHYGATRGAASVPPAAAPEPAAVTLGLMLASTISRLQLRCRATSRAALSFCCKPPRSA